MEELENDVDFQDTMKRLETLGTAQMSKEERTARRRALDDLGILSFEDFLQDRLMTTKNDDNNTSQHDQILLTRR